MTCDWLKSAILWQDRPTLCSGTSTITIISCHTRLLTLTTSCSISRSTRLWSHDPWIGFARYRAILTDLYRTISRRLSRIYLMGCRLIAASANCYMSIFQVHPTSRLLSTRPSTFWSNLRETTKPATVSEQLSSSGLKLLSHLCFYYCKWSMGNSWLCWGPLESAVWILVGILTHPPSFYYYHHQYDTITYWFVIVRILK